MPTYQTLTEGLQNTAVGKSFLVKEIWKMPGVKKSVTISPLHGKIKKYESKFFRRYGDICYDRCICN